MFERFNTPQDLFHFKLGAALKMENTVLAMLGDLEVAAQESDLKRQLRHHAEETRGQIGNLQKAFSELRELPEESPCPAIEAIEKEGKANMKKADDSLVDAVILAGAAETEHHEIAVYESLIMEAKAMGQKEIAKLLKENLEQEEHTLKEVRQAAGKLTKEQFATA